MLSSLRRRKLFIPVLLVLFLAGIAAVVLYLRRAPAETEQSRSDLESEAEAPPDLQKLRDAYTAGTEALARNDGVAAVKHLTSFDFGPRAVEEYRLYHLSSAQQLAGDGAAARRTLARLWRRTPRMVYAREVAFELAGSYAAAGDATRSAEVYAALARRSDAHDVAATARWNAAMQRLRTGDVSGALYAARAILVQAPASSEAKDAEALLRGVSGITASAPLPLTPSERLDRAIGLMQANAPQKALDELTALASAAPHLRREAELQRGIALHRLRRFEDSNKVLEPLTSGAYREAIPALRQAAKNYSIVAAAINPTVEKTLKEKKKVGTIKQKVGKGKKRRTVTRPKYQTVFRKVQLVDLEKKKKKDEYERLASERLKDLLLLPIDQDIRLETLNALIARAQAKNQDAYLQELVAEVIKIDNQADPALQHFWDKAWAAYTRGDLGTAKPLFKFITDTYTHVNVKRQARYWYARTSDRQGQKEEATAIYRELASAPYTDLYAMHAISRGAKHEKVGTNPLKKSGADWREIAEKEMPEELQLAYELTALSQMTDAALEIRRNNKRANSRFAEALLADVHHHAGNEILMYRSIRRAWPQLATVEQDYAPAYFIKMYYPVRFGEPIEKYAKERRLDPNLVRALILQESYYNPEAKSRVGATGLMQLMPPTAGEHARRLRIPFAVSRLENPEVNVRLGTYHLRMLIDLFRGNEYLAIASYNAGQGNVAKWRRAAPSRPLDELLESIPFPETRNYVKRVTMLRSSYSRLTI